MSKVAQKITKRFVDSLEVPEKDCYAWDNEIKGLGVRRFKGSTKKTYIYQYRFGHPPKVQCLKIGVHGSITPDLARQIAQKWAGQIASGVDPREEKKRGEPVHEEKALTLREFLQVYEEKHVQINNKPTTISANRARLNKHIIPFLGNKKLSCVTPKDIMALQNALKDTPIQFNRCYALLSKAFNMAEVWGYRERNTNPCHGISKFKENKKERFLSSEELIRLEESLAEETRLQLASPYAVGALRLLATTGCRLGEVLTLKWEDVHLEESFIHLKYSKTGEKVVPLNESSKMVLQGLPRQEGSPYVFCGKNPGAPLVNINKVWYRVRKRAGLEDMRIHDLRHSFASFAIKKGLDLYQVSKLLGHRNIQTTSRYAHIAKDDLIKASNIVGQVFNQGV